MIAQNNQQVIYGHCLRARGARGEQTRPYIYELDPLRAVTAVAVIAVHVLSGTMFLNHTAAGLLVQNGIFTSVHFTREIFMFITALALAYVYFGRPFSKKITSPLALDMWCILGALCALLTAGCSSSASSSALPSRTPLPETGVITTPIKSAGCGKPAPTPPGSSVI